MKIRYSSWHYKYIAKRWKEHPRALCWYFWKIVISIVLWAVAGVLALIAGSFVLVTLAFPAWQWFFNYDPDITIASFIFWLVIGVLASGFYRTWLYETGRLKRKPHVYKEPGLVSQYIEAKHRKICPLLEYTNE